MFWAVLIVVPSFLLPFFIHLCIRPSVRSFVRSFFNSTNRLVRWKSLKWLSTYTVVGSLNPRPKPACHLNRIITSLQRANWWKNKAQLSFFLWRQSVTSQSVSNYSRSCRERTPPSGNEKGVRNRSWPLTWM